MSVNKEFIECKSYSTAKRRAPYAAVIARVEGGFIAFYCVREYDMWRRQK